MLDQKLLVIIIEFFSTLNADIKQKIILERKDKIGLSIIEKIYALPTLKLQGVH